MAYGMLQCIDPLFVIYLLSLLAIFLNYGTKFSWKNWMPLPSSDPIITQPDSLLVVNFDYINSQLEL